MAQIWNGDFYKNILLILNPVIITPDQRVESINDVNFDELKEKGIENLICDADQTLVGYHESEIHENIKEIYNKIKNQFNMCILSNYVGNTLDDNRNQRQQEIEKNLGIKVIIGSRKKPSKKSYILAMDDMGSNKDNTAMIGDRLFTDIIGANALGMYTIWVKPFDRKKDPFLVTKVPRAIENFWYKAYKY